MNDKFKAIVLNQSGEQFSREVKNLNKAQILRATAETASENSVDGVFAPLFWMMFGTFRAPFKGPS